MQVSIPDFLEKNKMLKTIDSLSFAKYVSYKPMRKSSVVVKSNVLIYVRHGSKILHFSGFDKIIEAGNILFLKSGNYIMSEVVDSYYEALIFFYSDVLLGNFITKYNLQFNTTYSEKEELYLFHATPYLQNAILSILPYFDFNANDEEIVILKFEEIFLHMLKSDKEFKNFLQYVSSKESSLKMQIEQIYDTFETINDMAKYFKISELNFRNKFKSIFGVTPKKWILHQKLKKAKMLLEHRDMNVSEVCREVGFENISWFIQSYKKEFGVTPKQQKSHKN